MTPVAEMGVQAGKLDLAFQASDTPPRQAASRLRSPETRWGALGTPVHVHAAPQGARPATAPHIGENWGWGKP